MDAKQLRRRQQSNKAVSRIIPPFLILVVVYASYVSVGPLCVDYLLNPAPESRAPQRVAVGIALPIVYFLLMFPMAAAYFRLLYVVQLNPGFIERRNDLAEKPIGVHEETVSRRSCAPTTLVTGQEDGYLDFVGILEGRVPSPPGMEDFYTKDVFVCDQNGLPLWCPICRNWKPDRSHHSSDIGRCVMKMDHFCPWVSGCVGENSFKFFVQFNFYATIFTAYTLACMAVFVAESEKLTSSVGNVHWVVVIGLSGFFCFFTFGLNLMSFQMTLNEVTTIENIDAGMRTMYLAVLLPPEIHDQPILPQPPLTASTTPPSRSNDSSRPLTSEIDDPSHMSYFAGPRPLSSRRSRSKPELADISHSQSPPHESQSPHRRHRRRRTPTPKVWTSSITYPIPLNTAPPLPAATANPRTFAVLRTPPGLNPWNRGAYQNFTSVFGSSPHDWLLPVKYSPCCRHDNGVSDYGLGWEFEQLLEEAGLVQGGGGKEGRGGEEGLGGKRGERQREKRRKRKLDYGWQNGERPDGWVLEKEERRRRKRSRVEERGGAM
ncbi:hypothetical protein B0A48_07451 [Cryoendolithus antarcticus]|uniref:Palmitoyltransferase n=1 Tax=Cryoendolithus antarcticus TaxID=1507870 RepID=A0A1V8T648_9PEZI|nr:hypothetical protein B0A48_07451 [Cryoendolithus antarcticus]